MSDRCIRLELEKFKKRWYGDQIKLILLPALLSVQQNEGISIQ